MFGGDLVNQNIAWGDLYLGESKSVSFYVRPKSNVAVTLALTVTDWSPTEIAQYMSVTWNYDGRTLNVGEQIQVTLTLSSSTSNDFIMYLINNAVSSFRFNIHIFSSKS